MPWNPEQYSKFQSQREEPFEDLKKLITIRPNLKVLDLGCGTGELTAKLAVILPDCAIVGIDNSAEMLEKAQIHSATNVIFELKTIEDAEGDWDLIFSNAALHWVDDHYTLIPRLMNMLNPAGQLVVQIPSNHRNRAQNAIAEIANHEPYATAMTGWTWNFPVLPIDFYAELLYMHGGRDITIYDKVYPHVLENADAVMDWISGTTMVPYVGRLPEDLIEEFKTTVRKKLNDIWTKGPVFYPFRRIIFAVTKFGN